MKLERRITDLERRIVPGHAGLSLQDWTTEEIGQAIDLLINEVRPWPAKLQRKRKLTYFPPDNLTREQRHKWINELLVESGRQPIG